VIPIATADQMRRADRRATTELGVAGLVLMENAGRGAADLIERVFGPAPAQRIVLVCGKGNNGGDGFVVARHQFRVLSVDGHIVESQFPFTVRPRQ
jgi:NAD(P)H-hydrate epimerase